MDYSVRLSGDESDYLEEVRKGLATGYRPSPTASDAVNWVVDQAREAGFTEADAPKTWIKRNLKHKQWSFRLSKENDEFIKRLMEEASPTPYREPRFPDICRAIIRWKGKELW